MRRTLTWAAAALLPISLAVATPSADAASNATKPPKGSYAVKVVSVTDGDTIRIRYRGRSTPLRLIGIDAPEINPRECYGTQATTRMKQLTVGGTVYIRGDGTQGNTDRYGRLLRHLYTPGGRNIALRLVEGGYAKEYTHSRAYAGRTSYRSAQSTAKAARRGLWGPCAVTPKPAPKTTSSCKIKGNISSNGRIYHVPGQRYYSVTKIDTSKGERWFCTETQARNAGWRKSKV